MSTINNVYVYHSQFEPLSLIPDPLNTEYTVSYPEDDVHILSHASMVFNGKIPPLSNNIDIQDHVPYTF